MSRPTMTPVTQLPDDFPWDQTVGLLLDGLQVQNLIQRLYEWSGAPQLHVLYQGTQWGEISRISPCLIHLHKQDDPVLVQFLANTSKLWGYLLVSDGPWDALLTHMRWLTSFQPPQDEEMFLRIADPAVAQALFAAEHYPAAELFGPCQQIIVANAPLGGWTQFRRPDEKTLPRYDRPYTANDAQWSALKAVTFAKSMRGLYQHMQRFFPGYRTDLTPEQRLDHIHQLAASAIADGFASEQEIWLYATVFGFLGNEALEDHPDILELLTVRSELTPLQRVNRAATLAAQPSIHGR